MEIFHLQDQLQYLEEVATLTQKEWGKQNLSPKEFFSNSVNVELLFSAHVEHCVTFLHLQKCGCPWHGVFVLLLRFRTSP